MTNTLTVQLIGVAITLAFLAFIIRMVRANKLRSKYSFTWLVVGVLLITIVAVPGLLETLSTAAGIYYPPAFLFLCAIVFLLFLSVHVSWELSRLEDRTRTLAEEIGLLNAEVASLRAGAPEDEAPAARVREQLR